MTNPPAFPPNAGWRDNDPNCNGMTLLDYFAGQALAGLMTKYPDTLTPDELADYAYDIAQAMLPERARRGGDDDA